MYFYKISTHLFALQFHCRLKYHFNCNWFLKKKHEKYNKAQIEISMNRFYFPYSKNFWFPIFNYFTKKKQTYSIKVLFHYFTISWGSIIQLSSDECVHTGFRFSIKLRIPSCPSVVAILSTISSSPYFNADFKVIWFCS